MTQSRKDLSRLDGVKALLSQADLIVQNGTIGVRPTLRNIISRAQEELSGYVGSLKTQFSEWIRGNPVLDANSAGLSIHDVDWVIHQFKAVEDKNGPRKVNNLMLVEEKRFGRTTTFAQEDTFLCLHQLLSKGHRSKIQTKRGDRVIVRYFGFHTLTFSGAGPLDSERIWWTGKLIDIQTLERLLRFELNPITLRLRDAAERRHHANKSNCLPLFSHLPETESPN